METQQKKKRIVVAITGFFALILIVMLVAMYTNPRFYKKRRPDLFEMVRGFYTTVINRAQSHFTNK